jgi:hypothetical protein
MNTSIFKESKSVLQDQSNKNAYIISLIDGDILISCLIKELSIEKNGKSVNTSAFIVTKPLRILKEEASFELYNSYSSEEKFVFSGSHIINVSISNDNMKNEYYKAIKDLYDDDDEFPKNEFLNMGRN